MGRPTISEYQVKQAAVPNGDKYWYIVGRPNGKRIRAWFKTKEEAKAEATERNIAMRKLGQNVVTLDATLAETAREGATRLLPFGKTVKDAIDFYIEHLTALQRSISAKELETRVLGEFERRLQAEEISKPHYRSMRETMGKFSGKYGDTQISTLTGTQIKVWLATLQLAPKTRNRHFGYLRNAFGLAKEWEVLLNNPLENVAGFRVKRKQKIEILTPEEMKAFLAALDPDWLPFFAIHAYTGLRREEVSKLDWSEVKLERRWIDLPPEKSKNHRRKLEEIPDSLYDILKPRLQTHGQVQPRKKLQLAMERAAEKAGILWKQNVIRHSFCSYGVASRGLEWTADQSDHGIHLLKRDYREVVTKEDAEKYWAIRPNGDEVD